MGSRETTASSSRLRALEMLGRSMDPPNPETGGNFGLSQVLYQPEVANMPASGVFLYMEKSGYVYI